jgi:uncharacterized protein YjbI with pentapeptide repeats
MFVQGAGFATTQNSINSAASFETISLRPRHRITNLKNELLTMKSINMKNPLRLLSCLVWLFAALIVSGAEDHQGENLPKSDFSNKSLNGANFSDAILDYSYFRKTSLKKANFKGASIKWATFSGADLTETDFRETDGSASFDEANLSKANLEGVTLSGVHSNVNFRGANLKKTKISASFINCDFSGVDLRGANLRGSTHGNSRWKGALYDDDTAFPEGFDPKQAGMVLNNKTEEQKKGE